MQQLKYKISIPVALKQIWDTESSPRQIDSVDFFRQLEKSSSEEQTSEAKLLAQRIQRSSAKLQKLQADVKYLEQCFHVEAKNVKILAENTKLLADSLK